MSKCCIDSIFIECPKCKIKSEVNTEDIYFDFKSCDICGSHGYISVDFICTNCSHESEIFLREW